MINQERIALLRLIESLEGASSLHLHRLFFQHVQPRRLWHPRRMQPLPPEAIGITVESGRRRLQRMEDRGEIEFLFYKRPGGRGCAFFLTPLCYLTYGSFLKRSEAQPPSEALTRRGWQRGELWIAFQQAGATFEPGVDPQGTPLPYDVIKHQKHVAYVLVDAPHISCASLVKSIPPAPAGHRHPVMVVPGMDGSTWDHEAKRWTREGPRCHELKSAIADRGDCSLWEPPRLAGVGLLEDKRERAVARPHLQPMTAEQSHA
jgi:hypothetical protein